MNLSCEEVELSVLEPERSDAVRAHLSTCEKCRAFEKDLGLVQDLAALPEPTGAERARLLGLAPRTLQAVRSRQSRRLTFRRVAGLAIAASIGAVVAGAALRGGPVVAPRHINSPAQNDESALEFPLASVDDGMVADSDDDLEIIWPNPGEGEVQ